MSDSQFDRRRFLLSVGALTALAGCIGNGDSKSGDEGDDSTPGESDDDGTSGDGGETSTPTDTETQADDDDGGGTMDPAAVDYTLWFDEERERNFAMQTDFTRAQQVEAYSPLFSDKFGEVFSGGQDQDQSEPLFPTVENVVEAQVANLSLAAILLFGFSGFKYTFIQAVEVPWYVDEGDRPEDPVMTVEQIGLINEILVVEGPVDQEALLAREDVEKLETSGEYTIYQSTPGTGDPAPFASNGDRIVIPAADSGGETETTPDPRNVIESALSSASEGPTFPDDDLPWLIDHVGDGAFVLAGTPEAVTGEGEDSSAGELPNIDEETQQEFNDLVTSLKGFASVADGHENGRVTRTAMAFSDDMERPSQEELLSLVADGASDTSVTTDGNRIAIESVWEG